MTESASLQPRICATLAPTDRSMTNRAFGASGAFTRATGASYFLFKHGRCARRTWRQVQNKNCPVVDAVSPPYMNNALARLARSLFRRSASFSNTRFLGCGSFRLLRVTTSLDRRSSFPVPHSYTRLTHPQHGLSLQLSRACFCSNCVCSRREIWTSTGVRWCTRRTTTYWPTMARQRAVGRQPSIPSFFCRATHASARHTGLVGRMGKPRSYAT